MTTSTTRIIPGAFYDNNGAVRNAKHPSFGAKGDGTTDDTVALQACLTASLTKGDVCVIPPGDYKVTAPLIPPGSNAFMNSSKHRIIMHGARLFSYDATAGRSVFKLNSFINTEGALTLEGGTIDGASATATSNGVEIHSGNVKLDRMVIRTFTGGYGVSFVYDLAAPPICCELESCYIQNNRIGVYAPTSISLFYMHGGRCEHNREENIYLDTCGEISLDSVTVENPGDTIATKANLYIRNLVNGKINGCRFESSSGQTHTNVVIEGVSQTVHALVITACQFVNGESLGNAASIGLDLGPTAGAVESIVAHGNYFSGQTTAVRLGTNARGCLIGPDYFDDNFQVGTAWSSVTAYVVGNVVSLGGVSYICKLANTNQTPPNATYWSVSSRYLNASAGTNANIIFDINRYASAIYGTASVWQALLATSLKVSGGAFGAATIYKDATLGMTIAGVAGSTSDLTDLTPGGAAIREVPTGTIVSQFFGAIQETNVVLAYSASITPNVGTGTTAATTGNIQTITATNGTAFTINAPTGPRAGMRLRIRIRNTSGGALGVATWNAVFKMVAWVQPATGFSRSIDFDYDGTNWVEAYRSAADVAN